MKGLLSFGLRCTKFGKWQYLVPMSIERAANTVCRTAICMYGKQDTGNDYSDSHEETRNVAALPSTAARTAHPQTPVAFRHEPPGTNTSIIRPKRIPLSNQAEPCFQKPICTSRHSSPASRMPPPDHLLPAPPPRPHRRPRPARGGVRPQTNCARRLATTRC